MITLKAHAKINLTLDITGILDNGYHSLAMIMQSVALSDTVTITPSNKGFSFSTGSSRIPDNENNLVVKAARLFFDTYKFNDDISIHLKKNIPVSAGLAGGSADAAAVLVGLNEYFGCGLSESELQSLGLKLGADVPFCITGGTAFCEGVGEIITPLPNIPDCYILIVKPPQSMQTPRAFSLYDSFDGAIPSVDNFAAISAVKNGDLDSLCISMANKLQPVTEREHPIVNHLVLTLLQGNAKTALMSGSGTAVYGVFESRIVAEKCQNRLPNNVASYITTPSPAGVSLIR